MDRPEAPGAREAPLDGARVLSAARNEAAAQFFVACRDEDRQCTAERGAVGAEMRARAVDDDGQAGGEPAPDLDPDAVVEAIRFPMEPEQAAALAQCEFAT